MRQAKITLVVIIVLLVITSSFSVYGFILSQGNVNKEEKENLNHEFHFDGKLYYYNYMKLIGTYTCKTNDCDSAKSEIDDKNYALNYYNLNEDAGYIFVNNQYAFIRDGSDEVIIYDVVNNSEIDRVEAVKYYGLDLDEDLVIIKKNGSWGVVQLTSAYATPIDFKYSFIGVANNLTSDEDMIKSDIFVVKDVSGWKLINNRGVDLTSYFLSDIYDYNENYIITKSNSTYYLNNYFGSPLTSEQFIGMNFVEKYVGVLTSSNEYYIFDPQTNNEVSKRYNVSSINDVTYNLTINNSIELLINGEYKEEILIN